MDMEDEHGSYESQVDKVRQGALEVLQHYPMEARMRAQPLTPSRKKKGKKGQSPGAKKRGPKSATSSPSSAGKSQPSPGKDNSHLYFQGSTGGKFAGKSHLTYEDIMAYSSEPGFANMYDKFWGYFYSHGAFPSPSFLSEMGMTGQGQSQGQHLSNANQHANHPPNNLQSPIDQGRSLHPSNSLSQVVATGEHADLQHTHISHGARNMSNGSTEAQEQHINSASMDLSNTRSQHSSQFNSHISQQPNNNHVSSNNMFLPQNGQQFNQPHPNMHPTNNGKDPLGDLNQFTSRLNSNQVPNMSNGVSPMKVNGENLPGTVIDESVVRCEMEYNEKAFTDPTIGGVAIALSHGAVLFEVAKRELHATTGLKNPNRFSPTRISLVFYQHKRMNYTHHGWNEYERKLELLRQKRLEKVMEESSNGNLEAANEMEKLMKKKKAAKKDKIDITKTSAAKYKYMWDATAAYAQTLTTDSIITRWIDPQPMVTGPYQRWV